jgi:hypothetical protein
LKKGVIRIQFRRHTWLAESFGLPVCSVGRPYLENP